MSVSARCRPVAPLVALTMAGCATVAGAASTPTVAVVHVLRSRISLVKQHDGGVPVLLPTTMPLGSPDYTASSASRGSYRLEIDGAEPCNGANVCLYALFTGVRGRRRYGSAVELARGIHGSLARIQCGAACSPASIDWIERGSSTRSRPTRRSSRGRRSPLRSSTNLYRRRQSSNRRRAAVARDETYVRARGSRTSAVAGESRLGRVLQLR